MHGLRVCAARELVVSKLREGSLNSKLLLAFEMSGKLIRKGSTARHGSVYLKSQYEALIVSFKLAWATQLRHSQNLKRRHG